ncbi:MAG: hypothetical protein PHE19_06080 [Candidatus Cloacimonetes bacterium]|nr:hypothetical protein [Candidatus Cloacimonadota bacterium]
MEKEKKMKIKNQTDNYYGNLLNSGTIKRREGDSNLKEILEEIIEITTEMEKELTDEEPDNNKEDKE